MPFPLEMLIYLVYKCSLIRYSDKIRYSCVSTMFRILDGPKIMKATVCFEWAYCIQEERLAEASDKVNIRIRYTHSHIYFMLCKCFILSVVFY
jgi:hypothetical protein